MSGTDTPAVPEPHISVPGPRFLKLTENSIVDALQVRGVTDSTRGLKVYLGGSTEPMLVPNFTAKDFWDALERAVAS